MRRLLYPVAAMILICLVVGAAVIYSQAIRDPMGAEQVFRGHTGAVHDAAFDDQRGLVASCGDDGLRIWRLESAEEILHRPGSMKSIRFLPNCEMLCADSAAGILVIDGLDGKIKRVLGSAAPWIAMDVSANGEQAAGAFSPLFSSGSSFPKETFAIHVWSLADPTQDVELIGHEGPVLALAFHPKRPLLVSRSRDHTLRVWDLALGEQTNQSGTAVPLKDQSFNGEHSALAFSPDGAKLLAGHAVLTFPQLEEVTRFPVDDWGDYVLAGAFSPDHSMIATGHRDGTVRIRDSTTFQELSSFPVFLNDARVYAVTFSSHGKFLATAGRGMIGGFDALARNVPANDTAVRIWKTAHVKTEN